MKELDYKGSIGRQNQRWKFWRKKHAKRKTIWFVQNCWSQKENMSQKGLNVKYCCF